MSSFGQIPLKDVWSMLHECAPGHTRHLHTHHYSIRYQGKTYPAFPKGAHGKSDPPIETGHIRRMARFLGIYDCARRVLGI